MTDAGSARLQPRIVDPPELRITGPHLIAVIKAMAEFHHRLDEIHYLARTAESDPGNEFDTFPGEPTWAELYEAQVAELAGHIGELRIGGDR